MLLASGLTRSIVVPLLCHLTDIVASLSGSKRWLGLVDSDNLTYFMRLPTPSVNPHVNTAKMALSVASSPEEIREVQRLRYKVLAKSVYSNSAGLFLLLPIDAMYRRRRDDSAMA